MIAEPTPPRSRIDKREFGADPFSANQLPAARTEPSPPSRQAEANLLNCSGDGFCRARKSRVAHPQGMDAWRTACRQGCTYPEATCHTGRNKTSPLMILRALLLRANA